MVWQELGSKPDFGFPLVALSFHWIDPTVSSSEENEESCKELILKIVINVLKKLSASTQNFERLFPGPVDSHTSHIF